MAKPTDDRDAGEGRAQPQQTRSQETWNAILEAAAALFDAQGYEQTTTHQIAAQAGVSVGALYRYFDGKQTVLQELYRRESSALRERAMAEFSIADLVSGDLPGLLRKTLAVVVRVYRERPGLQRVFSEQSRKIPELVELRRSLDADIHETVRQILSVAPGVRLPDVEVGAYLISLFLESLMDDYMLYRREHTDFSEERIVAAASDFIMRYLLGHIE